jgi:hypothetical protein
VDEVDNMDDVDGPSLDCGKGAVSERGFSGLKGGGVKKDQVVFDYHLVFS